MFQSTDFVAEMNNAENYKTKFLNAELSFLTKQMEGRSIDAFNYGNLDYSTKDSVKDGLKDGLKSMATLGTVKFHTVQTPKYLILSGSDLHLLDTDTEGEISNHLIFNASRLEKSTISEIPLEGMIKAFAKQKGDNVKAYKISLATDGNPIELIIFSALVFTYATSGASAFSLNTQKNLEEIIIATDFLKKIGAKYANLKVDISF
ncbi:hypothetical protein LZQ00_11650 [Sphingobacterium sp. SRCM116780]|uniref:hypothetical protein n=1 Tax=Sphingobacterium sp. SRCM116780 TaxID=2907623 RepID=UPI001F2C0C61|nr:hypothetical protein [Sphingobacterium sp. SRCM116780]UIR54933.1 hypothetical protein LZQ00_11650 [Sphingobacterium sp. SRCM116780]